jgi:peptidyl-prolyl cis-trans isomerase C
MYRNKIDIKKEDLMRKGTFLIFIVPMLLVFFACAKKEEQKGPYLAKVGNVKIMQTDLEREFKNLPDFAKKIFVESGGKEKFLDELIKKELLYQEALKRGFDKDAEYLNKLEEFKKISLIGQLLGKEVESKTNVTEQEVKNYYDTHKELFSPFSQIRVSLILVKTEEEAKNILERLNKGEDFAKLARERSIDSGSAKNGGDLGFLSKGQMTPELEAVAVRLKTGEISVPLKTEFGYQIIKVTGKKLGKVVEFEKVKSLISQHLSAEKQKEVFDSYIESLKKSYKIDINKEAISKLVSEEQKKEGTQEKPEQTRESKKVPEQGTK